MLFSINSHIPPHQNIIPYDGEAYYLGQIYTPQESVELFNQLKTDINWQHDKINMFGKEIITKRKVAWYAESAIDYTYSKTTKKALLFTPTLLAIKEKIESLSQETYNACLLNLYHNGHESMGWHADNEPDIVKHSCIASLSLGAERKFSFKHRQTKEKIDIVLENGSLLLMKNTIQDHWLHQLSSSAKIFIPRINLTYRKMII